MNNYLINKGHNTTALLHTKAYTLIFFNVDSLVSVVNFFFKKLPLEGRRDHAISVMIGGLRYKRSGVLKCTFSYFLEHILLNF